MTAESLSARLRTLLDKALCLIGSHAFDEQRHVVASSNVAEVTKTCQRCGKTVHEYNPR